MTALNCKQSSRKQIQRRIFILIISVNIILSCFVFVVPLPENAHVFCHWALSWLRVKCVIYLSSPIKEYS